MNLLPKSTHGGFAALTWALLVGVAGPAPAQAQQRVLDKLEGGLQRLVPLDDGSVIVVTTVQARRALPAQGGGWTSSQVAAVASMRGKQRMFVSSWSGGPSWWLLRADAKDSSSTVWDNQMLGPFAVTAADTPAGKKTAARGAAAGATHMIGHDALPLDAGSVAAAPGGAGYLVYVASLEPDDANQLQRFGADGAAQPSFAANSAPLLEQAAL